MPLQSGTVDLQRVAITRRSKSSPVIYRVFTTIAVTYFIASTINYLYPESGHGSKSSVELPRRSETSEERTKKWQKQWEKANTAVGKSEPEVIHFMLPIWIRQQKPQPWQPDDPTWKSFQNLDSDKKRLKEIAETIRKPLMRQITVKYGRVLVDLAGDRSNGSFKLGFNESWRLTPPLYAPTTYEVPCVFLESGNITYGWRQLPNSVGGKMDRVFHPIMLAQAFFFGVQEFAWASYLITKARLTDQLNSLRTSGEKSTAPQKATRDETILKQLRFGGVSDKNKEALLPFLRGEYGDHDSRRAYRDFVKSMTYQGAIESACAVFRAQWFSGQEKLMQSHTRDGIVLRGNCAFVGERGTLHIHVMAVYSPETNSLIGLPIIKEAYITPNMDKWVGAGTTKANVKKTVVQPVGKDQTKLAASEPLKSQSSQEDTPRPDKSTADEQQEKKNEK